MSIEEKKQAIAEIIVKQNNLLKESASIAKRKPTKSVLVAIKRADKIVSIAIKVRHLEIEKRIIASQPLKKFPDGGISFVQEVGAEAFINKNGSIIN